MRPAEKLIEKLISEGIEDPEGDTAETKKRIADLALQLDGYKPTMQGDVMVCTFDDTEGAQMFYRALDKYDQKIRDAKWDGSKVKVFF